MPAYLQKLLLKNWIFKEGKNMDQKLQELLVERLNCSIEEAGRITRDLGQLQEELVPLLNAWVKGEAVDGETPYEGYTLNRLMTDYQMQFTGALLTLDWLLKEPETAKKALRYGIR